MCVQLDRRLNYPVVWRRLLIRNVNLPYTLLCLLLPRFQPIRRFQTTFSIRFNSSLTRFTVWKCTHAISSRLNDFSPTGDPDMSEPWCLTKHLLQFVSLKQASHQGWNEFESASSSKLIGYCETIRAKRVCEKGRSDQPFLLLFYIYNPFTIAQPRMLCTIFSCIYPTLPYPTPYPPPYPTPYSVYLGCAQLHQLL